MTFSVELLISLATVIATLAGGWALFRWRIGAVERELDRLSTRATENERRIAEVRSKSAQELADYKLTVAKDYATVAAILSIKEEILGEFHQLRDLVIQSITGRRTTPKG